MSDSPTPNSDQKAAVSRPDSVYEMLANDEQRSAGDAIKVTGRGNAHGG